MNKLIKKIYLKDNLRYLLKKHNLTALELADKVEDIGYETIGKIRRGENDNPTLKILDKLCTFFNIKIDDFLYTDLSKLSTDDIPRKILDFHKIPILDWDNLTELQNNKYLNDDYEQIVVNNKNLFALYIDNDIGKIEKGSYIIVNPTVKVKNNDYVLIENIESKNVLIRRIRTDQVLYLESLLIDKNIIEFKPTENKIIGVIIGYYKLKQFS